MGYYNTVCLNTQRAHSWALSEAAAGAWTHGTKWADSLAVEGPYWAGVRRKLSQPDPVAFSTASPSLRICYHVQYSLRQMCLNVRQWFYRAVLARKFTNFCTKVCKRSVPHISLQVALVAGAASLHQLLHWCVWPRGSRRQSIKPQARTTHSHAEIQRHAKMHPFSHSCLFCLGSYLVFMKEEAFSLFKHFKVRFQKYSSL